jgi:hypothetical protein
LQNSSGRGGGASNDHIRLQRDEFLRVTLYPVNVARRPASINPRVAALRPPELLKPRSERQDAGLRWGIALGQWDQNTDPPCPLDRLPARRERPCCCTANKSE